MAFDFSSTEETLRSHPAEILDAFARYSGTPDPLPGGVDWEALAAHGATMAYLALESDDPQASLAWSRLAVRVFRELKDRASDSLASRRYEFSEMRARANALAFNGVDQADPIRHPAELETWFLGSLRVAYEDAAAKVAEAEDQEDFDWQIDSETLDALRDSKERIGVIAGLAKLGLLNRGAEISRWIELEPSLP